MILKKRKTQVIKDSRGDRIFLGIVNTFCVVIVCIIAYPLIYVFSASISSGEAVMFGKVYFFPVDITLEGYVKVFENKDILIGFRNSIIYTSLGTAINMIMTTLIAFPLSRKKLVGRDLFMILITFTMFFSGGLIPTFLVVERLRMVDTIWAMVIPSAISTFYVIIMRTFFMSTIPEELWDSAAMDGCNNFQFLFFIVLPISTAVLAVLTLYYAVGHWNSYFSALIYLRSKHLLSLQIVLRSILMANQMNHESGDAGFTERVLVGLTIKYSVIIISSLPMILMYPFIQKYFVKGVMVGAVKG